MENKDTLISIVVVMLAILAITMLQMNQRNHNNQTALAHTETPQAMLQNKGYASRTE